LHPFAGGFVDENHPELGMRVPPEAEHREDASYKVETKVLPSVKAAGKLMQGSESHRPD